MGKSVITATPVAVTPSTRLHERREELRVVCGVSLASFSALLLELGLTRLFSVILFYHFAFLAISLALLGLGTGGIVASICRRRLARYTTRSVAAGCCTINYFAIVGMLVLILRIPVALQLSAANFLKLTAIYVSAAIPFVFTGVLLSTLFARETGRVGVLYGADLLGGALACLGLVPLLNHLGGPNTVMFAALAVALGSIVWSPGREDRQVACALCGILVLLIAANQLWGFIDVMYAKGVRLDRVSTVEFVRWNALARVEVDRKPDGSKWIVLDSDANSALVNVDPHAWRGPWQHDLMSAPPAVANVLRPRGDYAIIGPGGGVDILRAVANGSHNVEGIEINPIIANTIMRGHYAEYSYGLYDLPEVHVVVGDGRSFIRGTLSRFDVVQMTLVDTWASTAAGAMALTENYLYTTEAFEQYFRHLKRDGLIAVTRWEFKQPRESLRVVSVSLEALHHLQVQDASKNFIVISDGPLNEDGRPVVVLAKRVPFTSEEEQRVRAHVAEHPSLDILYSPSASPGNAFRQLITGNDPSSFARNYVYDVAPVSDDSPFFFFTLKPRQVLRSSSPGARGMDWKVNLGVLVLVVVTMISFIAVLLFLIVPLLARGGGKREWVVPLMYFVAIGLAYILVEIAFVQRFVLFLGNPTYALTVIVFLMLLSSGAGSVISRKWLLQTRHLRMVLGILVFTITGTAILLPGLISSMVGVRVPAKVLLTAAVLVPLGFLMGIPFPTGLRRASCNVGELERSAEYRTGPADLRSAADIGIVGWAWALNAGASVLGSDLAILTAIHFGLTVTLAFGAGAYLFACLLAGSVGKMGGRSA